MKEKNKNEEKTFTFEQYREIYFPRKGNESFPEKESSYQFGEWLADQTLQKIESTIKNTSGSKKR